MGIARKRKGNVIQITKPAGIWTGLETLEDRRLFAAINVAATSTLPVISATPPAFAGTVSDPAADVSVTLTAAGGGSPIGTWSAQTDGLGGWSLTTPALLSDGHYDLLVSAVDNGGADSGNASFPDSVIIDATQPSVTTDPFQVVVGANTTLTGTYADANISAIGVTLIDNNGGTYSYNATLDTVAGTWSAPVTIAGVPDGIYTVAIHATDLAANSSDTLADFMIVDTNSPSVQFDGLQTPTFVRNTTTLTGTFVEANIDTVIVTLDDGNGGVTTYRATTHTVNGTWSVAIPLINLADGGYVVRVTATDLANNATTTNAVAALTVDKTAPDVTFDAVQLPARVNAFKTITGSYADANISTVVVTLDDGHGGTTSYNATLGTLSATWSVTISVAGLSDGSYDVSATATDLAGNATDADAGASLEIDKTAGVLVDDLNSNLSTATITGTIAADVVALEVTVNSVTYTLAGHDITLAGNAWSLTLPSLADGTYLMAATATDDLGNMSTAQGQLLVDTTPPLVTLDNGQLPDAVNAAKTLVGTFTDTNLDTITLTFDDGQGGSRSYAATLDRANHTWSLTFLPPDGTYDVSVTAVDLAGNSTTISPAGLLTVDATAPTVAFDADQLPADVNTDPTLTGTYADAHIGTIVVTLDDRNGNTFSFNATLNTVAKTWSALITIAGLPDASYDVTVTGTDIFGNAAIESATGRLAVDTVAPAVTIDASQLPAITNGGKTITGTYADANIATIVLLLNGAHPVNATINSTDMTWTATVIATGLTDGAYAVSVVATDFAGNATTATDPSALTIDATIPTLTLDAGQLPAVIKADRTLTGTFADTHIAAVTVTLDNGHGGVTHLTATLNHVAGTWSVPVAIAGLADGAYAVSVNATDDAGNSITLTPTTLTVDTTAPVVTVGTGQLPATVNGPKTLTGTYTDANIASVVVTFGGHSYAATLSTGTWTVTLPITGLADGAYAVTAVATDGAGNTSAGAVAGTLTVDTTGPTVSGTPRLSANNRPALTGSVNDPAASVMVTLLGLSYTATNNGDGTWTIAANSLPVLPDGTYSVIAKATDAVGNQRISNEFLLIVDTVPPVVTVAGVVSAATSPALTGTVNDPAATILVTINGAQYHAANNGDGTWTLPAGAIAALPQGLYTPLVTATDLAGNAASATTPTGSVAIVSAPKTVLLGQGIKTLTFVDADGTTVTLTAGAGKISLSFVGVNTVITGTGKSRTVTATGGVREFDVAILANSDSLTITTNKKGDGLTTINRITGAGTLKSVTALTTQLTGGIAMTGSILTLRLQAIQADVTMVTPAKGVSITAQFIRTATLRLTTVKDLQATANFHNANIIGKTVGPVTLANVDTNNGGVAFGVTAKKLTSLTLKQGKNVLKWHKNFNAGIADFVVHA